MSKHSLCRRVRAVCTSSSPALMFAQVYVSQEQHLFPLGSEEKNSEESVSVRHPCQIVGVRMFLPLFQATMLLSGPLEGSQPSPTHQIYSSHQEPHHLLKDH